MRYAAQENGTVGAGDRELSPAGAPEVAWKGERATDPGTGHLERVGRGAHRIGGGVQAVQLGRDVPADGGRIVEVDAEIGVDDHSQHASAAGSHDGQLFEVVSRAG